jgi:TetR/AcrR family transcriptional regulator, transcriptional repressor for nem operon
MKEKRTRDQIVETADRLFYEKGYESTSFSDISAAVEKSRGNVTFHFKTKDEILEAVIDRRLDGTRRMLAQWETDGKTGAQRIRSFIHILIVNRSKIMRHGCPVGTLCNELAKLEHAAVPHASQLFTLFRDWLSRQFSLLGHQAKADALAMQVLAWSQGVATLANAFHDEDFIRREVRRLEDWLASLSSSASRPSKRKGTRPRARTK